MISERFGSNRPCDANFRRISRGRAGWRAKGSVGRWRPRCRRTIQRHQWRRRPPRADDSGRRDARPLATHPSRPPRLRRAGHRHGAGRPEPDLRDLGADADDPRRRDRGGARAQHLHGRRRGAGGLCATGVPTRGADCDCHGRTRPRRLCRPVWTERPLKQDRARSVGSRVLAEPAGYHRSRDLGRAHQPVSPRCRLPTQRSARGHDQPHCAPSSCQ